MNRIKNFITRMLGLSTVYVVTAHQGATDKTREICVFSDYDDATATYHRLCGVYKRDDDAVTLTERAVLTPEPKTYAYSVKHGDAAGRTFVLRHGGGAARFSFEFVRRLSAGVTATADWTDTEELSGAVFLGPVIIGAGLRGRLAHRLAKAIGRPIDYTGSAESTVRLVRSVNMAA